jgi:hypothetical protein
MTTDILYIGVVVQGDTYIVTYIMWGFAIQSRVRRHGHEESDWLTAGRGLARPGALKAKTNKRKPTK